jgi:hypothetical protein
LAHRSGSEVALREKLNVRPWGKLTSGRNMRMVCERAFAEFDPPDDQAGRSAEDLLSGPRVGRLRLFWAFASKDGYVRIFNGPVEAVCRRVLYKSEKPAKDEPPRDIAILYGSLPGEPPRNAVIYRKDPRRGRLTEESSEIIWYPSTNRFELKGVKVTGSR